MEVDEKQYLLPKKVFFIKEILPRKVLNLNFPIYLGSDMRSHIRERPDEEVVTAIKAAALLNSCIRSYALTNQNNFFWKYEKNYIL